MARRYSRRIMRYVRTSFFIYVIRTFRIRFVSRPTIYQRSECVDVYTTDSGRGGGCYFIESVHGCICHLDELRHHKVLGVGA